MLQILSEIHLFIAYVTKITKLENQNGCRLQP